VTTEFQPLQASRDVFNTLVKERAVYNHGVVMVDLGDENIEVAGKFVTYALYPDSLYSVLLTRSASKCKISIGYNPWSRQPRRHNIAAICERFGGGGHPVVGAISLPANQLDRAREIAVGILDELSR
jgi:nanoRNase/pAp phosphatase (c-di-AMP/oligoRNAs hydrolase)